MARDAIGAAGFDLLVKCPFNAAVLPSLPCCLTRFKAPLLLLACLLAPLAARAQDPANPAGPPAVPAPPPIVMPPVAPVPGTASSPGSEELVQMQLPNADVRDVLSYYERLTGKRLVLDSTIQGQINIVVNGKVTKSEAIKLIETALLLNGFSIVPGDGVTKVLGLSKNARGAGVSIYSDFSQLPEGELVVSYLFRLRYLDPTELQQILQQYITANLYTSFVALPKSGALLVTESTSVIRKLVQLVRDVDIPPAEVVEEFIRLERADATKAAEFLNAVFERKETTGPAPPGGRTRARPASNPQTGGNPPPNVAVPGVLDNPGLQTAVSGMTEDAIVVGKIQITADVRTNRVHVVTRPVNMPLVRRLILEYDANTPFAEPVKRRLKYVSARDVLPILVQSLTEPGSDQGAGGAPGQPGRPAAQTSQQNPLFANQNRNTSSPGTSTGSSGGGLNLTQGLETQQQDTTPSAVVVGNTKLIADPRDNAIIIQGSGEAVDRVSKILDQLDVRAPQVLISAVIGEFSLGDGFESGVDYVLQSHPVTAFTRFTGSAPVDRGTANGLISALSNSLGSFNGAGALIKATSNFSILVKLLESSNRFKTISRPVVFASNNKKAVIASGQEIAVPTQTLSNVGTAGGILNNGTSAVSSSIEFKSVTLQLEVIPLINSDNEVTLDIYQKIDSVVAGATVQIAGNSVPTIATRYVRSTVSVPNDSTIVLGGLIKQDESRNINGLPFLSRIPILGYLFRDTQRTNNRSELIILLHPVVTNTAKQLARGRYDEEQRYFMQGDLGGQLYPPGHPVPPPDSIRKAIRVTPKSNQKQKPVPRVTPAPKEVVRNEDVSPGR
jgi:general secretion pathway protein D